MNSENEFCKEDINDLLNILSEKIDELEESISELENAVDKNKIICGGIL